MLSCGEVLRLLAALSLVAACAPSPGPARLTPAAGSRHGGDDVRIEGALGTDDDGNPIPMIGHGPVAIYFDNRAALGVVIAGEYLIQVVTPKREEPGRIDVQLMFDDGLHYTIEDAFSYEEGSGLVIRPDIAP